MKKHITVIIVLIVLSVFVIATVTVYAIVKRHAAKQTEQAETKFRELMGFDIPDGVTVNRYHYDTSNGSCAIDLVFDPENYDAVFQTFEKEVVEKRRDIMIFQKEPIYNNTEDDNVIELDEVPGFKIFPIGLNWVQEKPMELIVGYEIGSEPKNGAESGFTWWLFVREVEGRYHIMIQDG